MATDTPTYDPTLDPYRVSESVLRDHFAPEGVVHPGFRIIALGRYVKGGAGSYGSVYAVTEDLGADRNRPHYCTHLLVLPSEAEGLSRAYAIHGHYDLTVGEAMADLDAR